MRRVVAAWRMLTGGAGVRDSHRRTLVACSGGADSSALAIALASASSNIIIAHVLHDLRDMKTAAADRDSAAALSRMLEVPFVEARVRVRARAGNLEANARQSRYRALARLARSGECRFIATAHHEDDLAETVLMRLLRGAGPRGLSGIRSARPLSRDVTLIRPMLGIGRSDAHAICRLADWQWVEDSTNADTSRLRAAVRHRVLPVLREIAPGFGRRVRAAAHLQSQSHDAMLAAAARFLAEHSSARADELAVSRRALRDLPVAVGGEVVLLMHDRLTSRQQGRRKLTNAVIVDILKLAASQQRRPTRSVTAGGIRFSAVDSMLAARTIDPGG